MTDITELAQREKFEAWAEERCALPWGYLKNRRTNTGYFSKHDYTSLWTAWKAAGAELVEELEKAQRYTEELREWNAGLAQESFERQQRIAELESRAVKLPQRYDLIGETDGNCSLNDAEMAPDNDGVYLRVRDVREMLTAAGIKVEAE